MREKYPVADDRFNFDDEYNLMESVKDMIVRIRNQRAEMNVGPLSASEFI
jgi:hypothetical protein